MRIDQLTLRHFKGFESQEFSFHPKFNLLIGKNGTGKTSALDALSVAVGSWFLGIKGADTRHIRPDEVMLSHFLHNGEGIRDDSFQKASREYRFRPDEVMLSHFLHNGEGTRDDPFQEASWEYQYPCEIAARGSVLKQRVSWSRRLHGPNGRTTYRDAASIKELAAKSDDSIRKGKDDVSLPLISYYGTGRLWNVPRDSYSVTDPMQVSNKAGLSRFAGYANSIDPRLSVSELTRWIARQSWITHQRNGNVTPVFEAVQRALVAHVEGATDLYFDAALGEVVVEMDGGKQPFSNLSDGQRCMLAMVGDMAQKAATLNPQYGDKVLQRTQGVVLIDELDLHLHPRWQRRIVGDLRRTFPKIQFICTTHSPFLIQSIQQGQLIQLDEQDVDSLEYENKSIEDIAEFVQGVEVPQSSQRAVELNKAAGRYYSLLQNPSSNPEELAQAEADYKKIAKRYSANPGLSAILELEAMARKKQG